MSSMRTMNQSYIFGLSAQTQTDKEDSDTQFYKNAFR